MVRFEVPVLVRVVTLPVTRLEFPDTDTFVTVTVFDTKRLAKTGVPVLVRVPIFALDRLEVPLLIMFVTFAVVVFEVVENMFVAVTELDTNTFRKDTGPDKLILGTVKVPLIVTFVADTVLLTTRFENTGVPSLVKDPIFTVAKFDVPVLVMVVRFAVVMFEDPMFAVARFEVPVLVRVVIFAVDRLEVPLLTIFVTFEVVTFIVVTAARVAITFVVVTELDTNRFATDKGPDISRLGTENELVTIIVGAINEVATFTVPRFEVPVLVRVVIFAVVRFDVPVETRVPIFAVVAFAKLVITFVVVIELDTERFDMARGEASVIDETLSVVTFARLVVTFVVVTEFVTARFVITPGPDTIRLDDTTFGEIKVAIFEVVRFASVADIFVVTTVGPLIMFEKIFVVTIFARLLV